MSVSTSYKPVTYFLEISFSAGGFGDEAREDNNRATLKKNVQLLTPMDGMGRGYLLWKM